MPYANPLDERARASRRKHYRDNTEQYKKRAEASRKHCEQIVRKSKEQPCMDCGRSYPYYVMDLDHRDPTQKVDVIGKIARCGERKLHRELAKCDVVCANCHRERTYGSVPPGGERSPKPLENKQQGSTPCTPALELGAVA